MKMAIQITCVAKKGIGFILILRADLLPLVQETPTLRLPCPECVW